MAQDSAFIGTEVKYLVEIQADGFDMARDDFNITLKLGSKSKTFEKSDLVDDIEMVDGQQKHTFYLVFDSAEFGAGTLVAIIRAYVPDTDYPDNIRTEVDRFDLMVIKKV